MNENATVLAKPNLERLPRPGVVAVNVLGFSLFT
jgi:hypothetical protein